MIAFFCSYHMHSVLALASSTCTRTLKEAGHVCLPDWCSCYAFASVCTHLCAFGHVGSRCLVIYVRVSICSHDEAARQGVRWRHDGRTCSGSVQCASQRYKRCRGVCTCILHMHILNVHLSMCVFAGVAVARNIQSYIIITSYTHIRATMCTGKEI